MTRGVGVGGRPQNRKEIDLHSILVSICYRPAYFNVSRPASIHCKAARPCDGQAHSVPFTPSPPAQVLVTRSRLGHLENML